MRDRPFPPIEPHATGMLDVGDGQAIYWEASGNPDGKPAIALHGGPGSGSSPGRRRWFDPDRYRLVQLDQRGCGRSTPHAGDLSTDLSTNTTHHLIADIERLREHLGIERWLVWGASWGVTLALAYAERFPERVTEMVLLSITMTRRADVRWFAHETGRFFPEEWARFRAAVPEADRDGDLVAAYDRLLNHADDPPSASRHRTTGRPGRTRSCRSRRGWRSRTRAGPTTGSGSGSRGSSRTTSRTPRGSRRTSCCANAHRLAGIPGVLLHGRLDLSGPPDVAWQLAQAWPGSELHFIAGGHTGDAEMDRRMLEALDRFAGR